MTTTDTICMPTSTVGLAWSPREWLGALPRPPAGTRICPRYGSRPNCLRMTVAAVFPLDDVSSQTNTISRMSPL